MADFTLESVQEEYEKIIQELADPEIISDWERFEALSKKKNLFEKVIEKQEELQNVRKQIEESQAILAANEEPDLSSLAEEELARLLERDKCLMKESNDLFLGLQKTEKGFSFKEKPLAESVVIEIRAGVGGEEAALFVKDLFLMYFGFAKTKEWKERTLDSSPTGLGGLKEIIFELKGKDVLPMMQYEAGVHRVQRIPLTEKSGRIHTSTASIAVLPRFKSSQSRINPGDLKIDFFRSSGPGGQNVNKRQTAVRITHLPSGLVVASQTERNQMQNRENAMAILEVRFLEKERIMAEEKVSGTRKSQIGLAKRAEKIRTYNFPQDRLTDHRVKKSWHNLESILAGNMDLIINSLQENLDETC